MVNLNKREKSIIAKVKKNMNITDAGRLYVETDTVAQANSKAFNLQKNGYKTVVRGKKVFIRWGHFSFTSLKVLISSYNFL